MKKLFTLTLLGLFLSFASQAQVLPIWGTTGCCVGGTSTLYDSSTTWTWSSSNTAVATVNATSGAVIGVAAGTTTITYTSGGSFATTTFTVYANPAPITGPSTVCAGATITMADATVGGSWSVTGAGSISSGGVLTGVSAGTANVYYTVGTGCSVTDAVTVTGSTGGAGYISGDSTVCAGSTITLSESVAGGTWSSGTTSVAVISPSGVVTGVAAGVTNITYTVPVTCGSVSTYYGINVFAPTTPTITCPSSVAIGTTGSSSASACCGVWSSSNTAVAAVNASTGTITGVAAGSATITYVVTTSCGTYTATAVVNITTLNRISGHINFGSAAVDSSSPIKVWLITYDSASHMLAAVDSTTTYSGGTSAYYSFMNEAANNYRVKAAIFPTVPSSTGYAPTYHTSSSYWSSANVINHVATGVDDNEDINMTYGTVTAGPGFIGGDVTTGANRGTNDGAPVVSMLIYARNASNNIVQSTYTDVSGHYSFSNLPVGTYSIYPEAINYATTAYTNVTITSAAATHNATSFVQHTVSHTITPSTVAVGNVKSFVSTITTFPNPTSGKLNIQWSETTTEAAHVTIADVTGKAIFTTTINMNQGAGASQLDLSNFTNGIYMISITSGTINYNGKVQVVR